MIINAKSDGAKFEAVDIHGAKFHGAILVYGPHICILSSHTKLSGINVPGNLRKGYPYALVICNIDDEIDSSQVPALTGILTRFTIVGSKAIFRKDESGTLFRRVYKTDGDMTFVGPVQKSLEDCMLPNVIITIMDSKFLDQKGWKPYAEEPSAEDKAASSAMRMKAKN